MDIQRWLNETVLPERPPSLPDECEEAQISRPKQPEQAAREKRRRKPSSSDSSLLAAPTLRKKSPLIARRAAVEESASNSSSSDAFHPTSCSGSSPSSHPYARKPRRKTRPERYEPAPRNIKTRGTHNRRHRKGESKETKRRSKRRKVDKSVAGVVQSFHAKNVPKDRLTLRPREKLGLFSKGRASSPVKGRGLPDLVFSEMRFLQKHKDQPEANPGTGVSKNKRKRDHAHAKEEEISAYFTSVRPALAERHGNIQAKEGCQQKKLREIDRPQQERSPVIDNAVPTVELGNKTSFLGFGSRGPRHESGSYISWSESVRASSATPAGRRIGTTAVKGQLDSVHDGQARGDTDSGDVLHSQPVPATVTRHITDVSDERFQVSSLAPANGRGSRSHSLPQHTSSPRRVNLVDRAAKRRTLESVTSPSSMPPFILNRTESQENHLRRPAHISGATRSKDAYSSGQFLDQHIPEYDPSQQKRRAVKSEKLDPQTSSSLGRLLQDCNTAFQDKRQVVAARTASDTYLEPLEISCQKEPRAHRIPHPTIQRIPTVRFSGIDEVHQPRAPGILGPGIYEQQEQRQGFPQEYGVDENPLLTEPYMGNDYGIDEDEVEFAREWGRETKPDPYGLDVEPLSETLMEDVDHVDSLETIEQGYPLVTGAGFWRPHRLY